MGQIKTGCTIDMSVGNGDDGGNENNDEVEDTDDNVMMTEHESPCVDITISYSTFLPRHVYTLSFLSSHHSLMVH